MLEFLAARRVARRCLGLSLILACSATEVRAQDSLVVAGRSSIQVPGSFQRANGFGDLLHLVHADGRSAAWVELEHEGIDSLTRLQAAREAVDTVSYERVRWEKGWFVVSGWTGDRGSYQKTIVWGDSAITLHIDFDRADQPYLVSAIEVLSRSFALVDNATVSAADGPSVSPSESLQSAQLQAEREPVAPSEPSVAESASQQENSGGDGRGSNTIGYVSLGVGALVGALATLGILLGVGKITSRSRPKQKAVARRASAEAQAANTPDPDRGTEDRPSAHTDSALQEPAARVQTFAAAVGASSRDMPTPVRVTETPPAADRSTTASYDCPTCGSANTTRVSLAYERARSDSVGFGMTTQGKVAVMVSASQSLSARDCAPPELRGSILGTLFLLIAYGATGFGILLFILAWFGDEPSIFPIAGFLLFFGMIALIAAHLSISGADREWNRQEYPRLRAMWEREWICFRCGRRWHV